MASSYEVAKSFDPLRRYPQTLDYPLRVVDYSSISGQSPAGQYQSDPLITAHDVDIDPSLLHECPKIPQLDSASLSPQFTQVLSGPDRRHRDRAFVCRLFIDRETRILKITSFDEGNPDMSDSFDREYCAYARLICHHAAPYVPRVFGYLKFPQATPFTSLNLPLLRYPAEALLLEDIRDARPLSAETLTLAVAIEATRAVEAVHAALVVHNDIVARNFLVVGEERVVIVDFDWAGSWPYDNLVTKNNMLRERGLVWGLVFQELPIYRVIMGNDRALRRKLWLEQREAWEWYGGGDEPEPASMEE